MGGPGIHQGRPQTVERRTLDALYMPALIATRFNPDPKAKYDALRAAGKPAKVAIVALMRKLIELANTMVKADQKWVPKVP